MKKVFLLLAVTSLLTNCKNDSEVTTSKRESIEDKRIHGVEETVYNHESYQIIEVDGVEYLTKYSGGICPLVKDTLQ